jgi:hypothetical protein
VRVSANVTCSTRARSGSGMRLSPRRSAPDSCVLGKEPFTSGPVDESVGEFGTVGKSKAGARAVVRGEFRKREAAQT